MPEISQAIDTCRSTVGRWLREAGLQPRFVNSPVTDEVREIIRSQWGRIPCREIASEVGRTKSSVNKIAANLGLRGLRIPDRKPLNWRSIVKTMVEDERSSYEIADAIGVDARYTRNLIKKLGLKTRPNRERWVSRVAAASKRQCAEAGVPSLAQFRIRCWREFAAERGWPTDLRIRSVQILELLCEYTMLSRRQICDGIGMPWKGSRQSLVSNDPEGSYLANLATRGLVVKSPRIQLPNVKGRGKGISYYTLSASARQMKAEFVRSQSKPSNNPPRAK